MPKPEAGYLPKINPREATVNVSDFDSFEQARIWLAYGPERAVARTVAMLRTAFLVADRIYLDRNQLLDGIIFLALGPAGVARALGLEPGQDLPLMVGCQPLPHTSPFGPITNEAERIELFSTQCRAVSDSGFASAAKVAWELGKEPRLKESFSAADTPPLTLDLAELLWDFQPRRDQKNLPDPGLFERARVNRQTFLKDSRQQWQEAANEGRIQLTAWPDITQISDREFWSGDDQNARAPQTQVLVDQLQDYLAGEQQQIFARKLVVKWAAQQVRSGQLQPTEARSVIRWWTQIYENAVFKVLKGRQAAVPGNDGIQVSRLAFTNTTLPEDAASLLGVDPLNPAEQQIEKTWGLRKERRTRWQVFKTRVNPQRIYTGGPLRIEGQIIQAVHDMQPAQYRQLHNHPLVDRVQLRDSNSPRAWNDLILAIRDLADDTRSWGSRLKTGVFRFLFLAFFAIILGLHDAGLLDGIFDRTFHGFFGTNLGSGFFDLTLWTLIAILVAFPYAELKELWRMGPTSMSSTMYFEAV
ncbi:hypothetical protein [Boudabousia liubingyangii]|uniref:hypothetical protein n=1 Tax=Boudabousia liubingyangii TaxID=1921764 RepID=UPI00093FCF16|nr:hypothetical protein [Boudabousia liubingyangii]